MWVVTPLGPPSCPNLGARLPPGGGLCVFGMQIASHLHLGPWAVSPAVRQGNGVTHLEVLGPPWGDVCSVFSRTERRQKLFFSVFPNMSPRTLVPADQALPVHPQNEGRSLSRALTWELGAGPTKLCSQGRTSPRPGPSSLFCITSHGPLAFQPRPQLGAPGAPRASRSHLHAGGTCSCKLAQPH